MRVKPSSLKKTITIISTVCALLMLTPAAPLKAQQKNKPVPEAPPPVYEKDLTRLSEIMGSLAFLRDLCGATDSEEWPTRMKALIETETQAGPRRDRLAGAYNKGYRNFATTYRTCTPSAIAAIKRYLKEGETLAGTISSRFGG